MTTTESQDVSKDKVEEPVRQEAKQSVEAAQAATEDLQETSGESPEPEESAQNEGDNDSEDLQDDGPDFSMEEPGVMAHPAAFGEIPASGAVDPDNQNVEMLLDVELTVTVELGRKKMLIGDILKLGKGSVIELAKAAGEMLDVYINGTRLAKGEVVVIEDTFAIRITELANTRERINSLAV